MKLAEHMGLPIVCFVNTPGAYPGVAAEERGQARAIAENIYHMFGLKVPVVVMVIGEGGSGGALGIGVGDRVGMMENSWYSVISPEGCSSILWRSADGKEAAADALKLTAPHLVELGIVDKVVAEPVGGAHSQAEEAMDLVGQQISTWLDELGALSVEDLLSQRETKFRRIAQVQAQTLESETPSQAEAGPVSQDFVDPARSAPPAQVPLEAPLEPSEDVEQGRN
jgi:acetyl-CoA carboxylase carboxyl transferase subunit alpha